MFVIEPSRVNVHLMSKLQLETLVLESPKCISETIPARL